MSFQSVISMCRAPEGVSASGWFYIDTGRVLRASPGLSVPSGLTGLSDCVEVSCKDNSSFTVRRRDGSVYWVYRTHITSSGNPAIYEYTLYSPETVLDGETLGVVLEAVSDQFLESGGYNSHLMMRNSQGRAFSVLRYGTGSGTGYRVNLTAYVSKRVGASGLFIDATALGRRNYTGNDGRWVEYANRSDPRVETPQGTGAKGEVYKYSFGAVSESSLPHVFEPAFLTAQSQRSNLEHRILLYKHQGPSINYPYGQSGGIFEVGGERYVSLFYYGGGTKFTSRANSSGERIFPAPSAVDVFEEGWITAEGQIFWLQPTSYTKATIGPLNTTWSDRSLVATGSMTATLVARLEDLVGSGIVARGGFSADLQAFLTLGFAVQAVGTLDVRWDPEFGNTVALVAEFPLSPGVSINLGRFLTENTTAPFGSGLFMGVGTLSAMLLAERALVAEFVGVAGIQMLLGDRSGFPEGIGFAAAASARAQIVVGRVYPDAIVRLERAAGVVSLGPENDVMLRGTRYQNARWTREGSIPLGLNWGSSPEGLRFWGTPQETGEMTAIFEGPYPDGFQSTLTDAGQQSGGQPGCADLGTRGSFVVERYEVKFLITEVPGVTDGVDAGTVVPTTYTLGEALAELLINPSNSQTMRRRAWEGTRCIGARGVTTRVTRSDVAGVAPASVPAKASRLFYHFPSADRTDYPTPAGILAAPVRLVHAGDVTPQDLAASDWVLSIAGVVPRGQRGVLRTAGVQTQSLSAETALDYADYVGEALDGERRVCAFQAEVPILPGVTWGEFYMTSGFTGAVTLLYYTLRAGVVLETPAAELGVKFFHRIQEAGSEAYRDPDAVGLAYDAVSAAEGIYRAVLPVESRQGIFRLSAPLDAPPGAVANLSIFLAREVGV